MVEEVKPNQEPVKETAKPMTLDEVEAVKKKLAELKAVNDAYDSEKLRAEKIRAEQMMGGKSLMTPQAPVKSKAEELNELLKGSPIRLK